MPPRFMTNIRDAEVFVAEGEPAMFECRVEPKHDLNLSVRWYRNDEELVSGGRLRISHEYGHVALHIFYTYPEDEGRYVCRATNELGEDMTEASLVCRPLPHLQFQLPPFETEDPSEQLQLIKEATQRHGGPTQSRTCPRSPCSRLLHEWSPCSPGSVNQPQQIQWSCLQYSQHQCCRHA